MDPEQRLLVIVENLAVKGLVLLVRAVLGGLCPERMRVIAEDRTAAYLQTLLLGLLSLFSLFLVGLRLFGGLDHLDDYVIGPALRLIDDIGHLGIMLGEINLDRHERAVLLDDFLGTVVVGKLHAVLGEMQGNGRTDFLPVSVIHGKGTAAVALPVHRLCALLVGQCIDLNKLCNHECAVEAQTEVTDDLIVACLIFILLHKGFRTGESDVINVFLYLISSHTQTVVGHFDRLVLRADFDVDPCLVSFRQLIVAHHIQLFQLCDRITAVGDELSVENIMIRIQPFLDDRKHVFTVDR